MGISPGHVVCGPDDRAVLFAVAALMCGHHKAKMLVNVVFCCLCQERDRISPGHACRGPDDWPVLPDGAALYLFITQ
jgi:hypothetical protein